LDAYLALTLAFADAIARWRSKVARVRVNPLGAEGELPWIYLGAWGGESTPRPYGNLTRRPAALTETEEKGVDTVCCVRYNT